MRTHHDPGGRAEQESKVPKDSVVQDFNIPSSTPLANWGYEPDEEHEPQDSCSSPSRKSDCINPELRFSTRKSDEIVLGIFMFANFTLILLQILLPSLLNPVYQTINEKTPQQCSHSCHPRQCTYWCAGHRELSTVPPYPTWHRGFTRSRSQTISWLKSWGNLFFKLRFHSTGTKSLIGGNIIDGNFPVEL